jgi:Rieske Fe-S protein
METEQKKEIKPTVSRRNLFKMIAASGGTIILGSWLSGCAAGDPTQAASQSGSGSSTGVFTVDLTRTENQALQTVGGAIALGNNPIDPAGILLYRESATSVVAFSRKCTHMGCLIASFQNGVSTCPCHGSQYNTKGQAIRGPSNQALKRYTATLSGTGVIISNAS